MSAQYAYTPQNDGGPYVTLAQAVEQTGIPAEDLQLAVEVGRLRGFVIGKRRIAGLRIAVGGLPEFAERWRAGERISAPTAKAECGVYMLFLHGDPVYVGRSSRLASRIRAHTLSGREFDAVEVVRCDADTSVWLERELIRTLRPKQNRLRYSGHAKVASVALARAGL